MTTTAQPIATTEQSIHYAILCATQRAHQTDIYTETQHPELSFRFDLPMRDILGALHSDMYSFSSVTDYYLNELAVSMSFGSGSKKSWLIDTC